MDQKQEYKDADAAPRKDLRGSFAPLQDRKICYLVLGGISNLSSKRREKRQPNQSNMANFLLLAVFFLAFSSSGRCNGKCISGTFDATTSISFVTNEHYGNNENCLISIRPSALHSSGFYLEMKWLVFEVEGKMPECRHDFVEVSLTR